jgi:hypothetical protein
LRLHLANLNDLVRDVKVNVRVANQSIVTNHGDTLAVGRLDNRSRNLAIVRRDNQDVDTLGQQVVALLGLDRIVTVGHLYFALSAGLLAALFNQCFVALPPFFFERVHRKANAHGTRSFDSLAAVAFRALNARREHNRSDKYEHDQPGNRFHGFVLS